MNQKMRMPAHYAMLDKDEMTYVDGGAGIEAFILSTLALYAASQFVPKLIVFAFTKIRDFFVSYIPMPLGGKND